MSDERKGEILRGLENHDTEEVSAMEEIKFGRTGEVMREVQAEQGDPPEQRTLTAAVQRMIRTMKADGNLDDATYPAYLDEEIEASV
jgi:hypothetical protein